MEIVVFFSSDVYLDIFVLKPLASRTEPKASQKIRKALLLGPDGFQTLLLRGG